MPSPRVASPGEKRSLDTTVLIPVKVPDTRYLRGLDRCFQEWFARFADLRVVVVDDSPAVVFRSNARLWVDMPIEHFATPEWYRTGTNNKSNAIHAGLERIATSYALLLDDDLRPDGDALWNLRCRLEQYPLVRGRVYSHDLVWYESLNLCEQYLARVFDDRWQPFGHLAIRVEPFRAAGMFDKDVIFDDLEIERHCQAHDLALAVADDIAVPLVSHGFRHFCRQRLIYAYETLAFPFMFRFLLSILPVACLLAMWSVAGAVAWLAFVMVSCWCSVLIGWSRIRSEHLPWWTTLGAFPLVASYAVMVWIAAYRRRAGGVWFGGARQRFVPGDRGTVTVRGTRPGSAATPRTPRRLEDPL